MQMMLGMFGNSRGARRGSAHPHPLILPPSMSRHGDSYTSPRCSAGTGSQARLSTADQANGRRELSRGRRSK